MKFKDLNCKECVFDHCDITELPCRNCKDEYSNFKVKEDKPTYNNDCKLAQSWH